MPYRVKLLPKVFVFLVILFTSIACGQSEKPPNVIVIVTDDQGWADIGYNNPDAYTPNMDRLAENGATFKNHYAMPQCTPTRVALITGRYPSRFGNSALQASNSQVFPLDTFTMANMFKEKGYKTALFGKWHMGSDKKYGPNNYGFDYSYGSLAGAVGMYDHRYRSGNEYEITWHRNLEIIPGYENGTHATDLVTSDAADYIHEDHSKPFFMYIPYHAVHTPLDERGQFTAQPTKPDSDNEGRWLNEDQIKWFNDPEGKIQSEQDMDKRLFLAALYHLDTAIGRIVNALEESGQRDNTIILFTSDNGPQVRWGGDAYPDDIHVVDFNQPDDLRGNKLDVYEGGIYVPGFANWPGHIEPSVVTEPTHVVDFMPTLANLIDYEIDQNFSADGKDLSPLLFEDGNLDERQLYWVWGRNSNRWALKHGQWKIVKYSNKAPEKPGDWELYNLAEDESEQNDVSGSHPDTVRELHNMFQVQRAKDEAK